MKKIFVSLMALTLASMPLCDCSAIEAEDQSDVTTSQIHPVESANGKGKQVGVGYANKRGKKIAAATAATTATAAAGIAAYKLKDYYQAATSETTGTSNTAAAASETAGTSDSEFVDAGNNTSSNLTNSTVNFVSDNATSDVDADIDDLDESQDKDTPKQDESSETKPTFWDQINAHVWSPLYDYVLLPTGTFARDYVWSTLKEKIDTDPQEAGVAGALMATGVTGMITTYEPDPFEAILTKDVLRSTDEDDKLKNLGSKLSEVTKMIEPIAAKLAPKLKPLNQEATPEDDGTVLTKAKEQLTNTVAAGLSEMIGGTVVGAGTKVTATNGMSLRRRLQNVLAIATTVYGAVLMWVL